MVEERIRSPRSVLVLLGLGLSGAALGWAVPFDTLSSKNLWQSQVTPGDLSAAHAFLEDDCSACHVPVRGAVAQKCILCHADDRDLLQRQPTAFHADVGECRKCHAEHAGMDSRPSRMNHGELALIGLQHLEMEGASPAAAGRARRVARWMREIPTAVRRGGSDLSAEEATLQCATCHQNDDRHLGFFGTDCSTCHGTDSWMIQAFRHPGPMSHDCAQCHRAPPSHHMGHFQMVSARVAGKPHARVEQCFLCHQTNSWNDIKDVGFYKHH